MNYNICDQEQLSTRLALLMYAIIATKEGGLIQLELEQGEPVNRFFATLMARDLPIEILDFQEVENTELPYNLVMFRKTGSILLGNYLSTLHRRLSMEATTHELFRCVFSRIGRLIQERLPV